MKTLLFVSGLGVPELLIILAVVLLLFGGSRLAGLGKSTGRALKEFKEETRGISKGDADKNNPAAASSDVPRDAAGNPWPQTPSQNVRSDQGPYSAPGDVSDARRDV